MYHQNRRIYHAALVYAVQQLLQHSVTVIIVFPDGIDPVKGGMERLVTEAAGITEGK